MRGDRPFYHPRPRCRKQATPHARGSTSLPPVTVHISFGYPACAGIDLDKACISLFDLRLPRMRGDRPPKKPLPRPRPRATPHARGSTVSFALLDTGPYGYPACAGIDLCQTATRPSSCRLPRMRGDRPYQTILFVVAQMATRMRG